MKNGQEYIRKHVIRNILPHFIQNIVLYRHQNQRKRKKKKIIFLTIVTGGLGLMIGIMMEFVIGIRQKNKPQVHFEKFANEIFYMRTTK